MPVTSDRVEENKRAAKRIGEAATNGDLDALDDVLAADVVARWPGIAPVRGREGYKETIRGFRAAFSDFAVEDRDAVGEGDTVCRRFTVRGVHEGEFVGVEATGNSIEGMGMNVARFEDGRIVEETTYADMFGLFVQLGVVELPERGATDPPSTERDRRAGGSETARSGEGSTTTPEENKAIARRFPEGVATEGNVGLVEELCAEDVIDHNPLGDARGRNELVEHVEYLHDAFADASATVEEIYAEDDTVAMRVTLRGRHVGDFLGVEPTGEEFEVANVVFTRVEDGLIAERWVLPDVLGILRQLGAVELPGE